MSHECQGGSIHHTLGVSKFRITESMDSMHKETVIRKASMSRRRHAAAINKCDIWRSINPLRWRHNDHDSVSNHQPHGCLLNRLFRHRSKKTSKLRVTGLCVGNSPGPVNSPHKGPVTRKMFPFDDVIMHVNLIQLSNWPGSVHICGHRTPEVTRSNGPGLRTITINRYRAFVCYWGHVWQRYANFTSVKFYMMFDTCQNSSKTNRACENDFLMNFII